MLAVTMKQVLLVEDNETDAAQIQRTLRMAGVANSIHHVRTGAEAIRKYVDDLGRRIANCGHDLGRAVAVRVEESGCGRLTLAKCRAIMGLGLC